MREQTERFAFELCGYAIAGNRLLPRWLFPADESFVGDVLEAIHELDGLAASEVSRTLLVLHELATQAHVSTRVVEALWLLERDRWGARLDAPVAPRALRDVLFELGARFAPADAVSETARRFGIADDEVLPSLFADRECRRILIAPPERARPRELIERYNRALLAAVTAASLEVDAKVEGDALRFVTATKQDRLLARFASGGGATWLSLTGPATLGHEVHTYASALGRLVVAIMAADGAVLRTRLVLAGKSVELQIERADAIPFGVAAPRPPSFAYEHLGKKVADVLSIASVHVDLDPGLVSVGEGFLAPDFALEWAGERVLVDIVPFATPEYLAAKVRAVQTSPVPLVVCVDERFVTQPASWIHPYRAEIEPWALLAAARVAVGRRKTAAPLRLAVLPRPSASKTAPMPTTSSSRSSSSSERA